MAEPPAAVALVRRDGSAEFHCTGCGTYVVRFGGPGPALCATCQFLPGWQDDPHLRAILREQPGAADG